MMSQDNDVCACCGVKTEYGEGHVEPFREPGNARTVMLRMCHFCWAAAKPNLDLVQQSGLLGLTDPGFRASVLLSHTKRELVIL